MLCSVCGAMFFVSDTAGVRHLQTGSASQQYPCNGDQSLCNDDTWRGEGGVKLTI